MPKIDQIVIKSIILLTIEDKIIAITIIAIESTILSFI